MCNNSGAISFVLIHHSSYSSFVLLVLLFNNFENWPFVYLILIFISNLFINLLFFPNSSVCFLNFHTISDNSLSYFEFSKVGSNFLVSLNENTSFFGFRFALMTRMLSRQILVEVWWDVFCSRLTVYIR